MKKTFLTIFFFFFRISRGFAVESILSAAFGLEGKSQSEINKRITAYGQLFFGGHGKLWAVLQWLPYSGHYMKYWPDDFLNSMKQMYKDVKVLVENRKQSSVKKHVSNENSLSICHANTAQKMKFSIKDFVSKCDQIRRFLRIWSHLLKKS